MYQKFPQATTYNLSTEYIITDQNTCKNIKE